MHISNSSNRLSLVLLEESSGGAVVAMFVHESGGGAVVAMCVQPDLDLIKWGHSDCHLHNLGMCSPMILSLVFPMSRAGS
jgi:hypothetical protein